MLCKGNGIFGGKYDIRVVLGAEGSVNHTNVQLTAICKVFDRLYIKERTDVTFEDLIKWEILGSQMLPIFFSKNLPNRCNKNRKKKLDNYKI